MVYQWEGDRTRQAQRWAFALDYPTDDIVIAADGVNMDPPGSSEPSRSMLLFAIRLYHIVGSTALLRRQTSGSPITMIVTGPMRLSRLLDGMFPTVNG